MATADGKGKYSGIEGQTWTRPKGKTNNYSLMHARVGPLIFHRDDVFAAEWTRDGTTLTAATAKEARMVMLTVRWSVQHRLLATAALVAGDVHFCAGRQVGDEGAGLLVAVATANGRRLGEWPIPGVPVTDGMAATEGRLFASATDGSVVCLGSVQQTPAR